GIGFTCLTLNYLLLDAWGGNFVPMLWLAILYAHIPLLQFPYRFPKPVWEIERRIVWWFTSLSAIGFTFHFIYIFYTTVDPAVSFNTSLALAVMGAEINWLILVLLRATARLSALERDQSGLS